MNAWARLAVVGAVALTACGGSDGIPADNVDLDATGGDTASMSGDTMTTADVITPSDGACPGTMVNCGGVCRDLSADDRSCGMCGRECSALQKCVSGVCACTTGKLCGGNCVDTAKDPANCGDCGRACGGPTAACVGGTCTCPATAKVCGSLCTDVQNNYENCGDCGRRCGEREACIAGACVCKPGLTMCGTTCVDTTGSATNCGMCGKACAAGELCTAGACVKATGCSGGLRLCGGACVDTRKSNTNCGDCGNACGADQICVDGNCEDYRPAPFCTTCPCPCGDRRCCAPLSAGGAALCVDADKCP